MNIWLIPTLLLAAALYWLGRRITLRSFLSTGMRRALFLSGLAAALPGLLFALYYVHLFTEPIWLYSFRALPGSEVAASGLGWLGGILTVISNSPDPLLQKSLSASRIFLTILLLAPHIKPLALTPQWSKFHDDWKSDICLQSSPSSCGPSCAATLLRLQGCTATELDLARECFTSRTGTENWYLARALRRRGLKVHFVLAADSEELPSPSIAGVRLGGPSGPGHFIVVLGKAGDRYILGDPLSGRLECSKADMARRYQFTGLFLIVESRDKPQ